MSDSNTPILNHHAILHCPALLPALGNVELENRETESMQKLKMWKVTLMKTGQAATMGHMQTQVMSSCVDAKRKVEQTHGETQSSEECSKCRKASEFQASLGRNTAPRPLIAILFR